MAHTRPLLPEQAPAAAALLGRAFRDVPAYLAIFDRHSVDERLAAITRVKRGLCEAYARYAEADALWEGDRLVGVALVAAPGRYPPGLGADLFVYRHCLTIGRRPIQGPPGGRRSNMRVWPAPTRAPHPHPPRAHTSTSAPAARSARYNLFMSTRSFPVLVVTAALLSLLAACSSGGGGSSSGGFAGGGGAAGGQGGSGGAGGGVMTGGGQDGQGGSVVVAGEGQPCGQSANGAVCSTGFACCYPCGIPDCDFVCTVACDPAEPGCTNGCIPAP